MTDKTDQLKEIREKITRTDEEMAELFRRRMELVEQVGLYKKANSLPVYDPERERQVLMEGARRMDDPKIRAPVSYTHLDVYKRQLLAFFILPASCKIPANIC